MARGRGGHYDSDVVVVKTARRSHLPDENFDLDFDTATRKAQRVSNYAFTDADALKTASRRHDQALLDDITSKLYKLDFDRVKPGREVALKTGFRRKMYHKKLPPLEKEFKDEHRRDALRYPYDYTTDNIYHYKPKPKKGKKKQQQQREPKPWDPKPKDNEEEVSPYPLYDPLGLYHKRPKREHKPLADYTDPYKDMGVREMLTKLRVKSQLQPRGRDPSADVDALLADLSRPLPKSSVSDYVPYQPEQYSYYDTSSDHEDYEMDSLVRKKIAASKGDLADFEKMLEERFRASGNRRSAAAAAAAEAERRRQLARSEAQLADMELEHELGNPYRGGYDQYYDEPLVNEVIIAPRTSSRVGVSRGAIPRRSHSLPRQSRQTLAEIEADVEAQMVRDLHPPAPLSTLRSKAVEARSKLDRHRTLLDRYLPLNLGPENDVSYEVENKYGELVQRYPEEE